MKFECERKAFADALRIVGRAATEKPGAPFPGIHLKLAGDGGWLEIEAANGETAIATRVATTYTEEMGETLIPKGILQEILARMGGSIISFRHDAAGGLAHIASGGARLSIRTQGAKNCPPVPRVTEDSIGFDMGRDIFSSLVRKTAFACSKDFVRPVFTGCHFTIQDGMATMAATNSHRLAVKTCKASGLRDMQGIIVPATTLQEAARILKDDGAGPDLYIFPVKGKAGAGMLGFDFGDTRMTSQIIGGQYPDIWRVIPEEAKTTATMRTEEFMAALERVSIIAKSTDYHTVRLKFTNGNVRIVSENHEIGNAEETVRADLAGEGMAISFNAHYLIEALKILDGEKLTMGMNGELSPAKITDDDEGFLYVVTPVRMRS